MHLLSTGIVQDLLDRNIENIGLSNINNRLKLTQYITISRGLRPLKERSKFKATELRAFALYYGQLLFMDDKIISEAWKLLRKLEIKSRIQDIESIRNVCEDLYEQLIQIHSEQNMTIKRHSLLNYHLFIKWNGDPRFWRADGYEGYLSMVRATTKGVSNMSNQFV